MLGRLARYLRILGFSVIYEQDGIDDDRIVEVCRDNSYILITRDRLLSRRYNPSILITSTQIGSQIIEFTSVYKPDRKRLFMRCTVCNGILLPIKLEENDYRSKLNPYKCSACGKLYWSGTHPTNIIEYLERLGVWNEDK